MTKHFLVAPAIDVDITAGFMDSMDPAVAHERLLIVDNTESGEISDRWIDRVAGCLFPGRNLGVAASWNWGIRQALVADAEMATLCSTAIRFDDGAHALCRTADLAIENSQWPYGFESMNGWHLITLSRRVFEEIGYFDEQFYPAYSEDTDYIRRMRLAKILEPEGGDRSLRKLPWIGALQYELVETAHAIKRCGVHVDFVKLQHYYFEKWGGSPGFEVYTEPFGAPHEKMPGLRAT